MYLSSINHVSPLIGRTHGRDDAIGHSILVVLSDLSLPSGRSIDHVCAAALAVLSASILSLGMASISAGPRLSVSYGPHLLWIVWMMTCAHMLPWLCLLLFFLRVLCCLDASSRRTLMVVSGDTLFLQDMVSDLTFELVVVIVATRASGHLVRVVILVILVL